MESPRVSVIIPVYNNAEFLGEAIQSVLDQTYPNFELIVVNDASPDHSGEIVRQFEDSRIKYIVHEKNQGLAAARNTGMRASHGEFIALLDGDDIFHPEKLQAHVEFLNRNPDVDVTYNARFELNHSVKTIRELWRPPTTVTLADLVLGFPFSPSDMVLRREWAFRVDLFDEYHKYVGEDLDINCRLAIEGCKFRSVDRALNFRRYHSGRIIKDLRKSVEDTIRPLNAIFGDPRCPIEVLELRNLAFATHYLLWSAIAFAQDDTTLGQEYCLASLRLNPLFFKGNPCQLIETLVDYSIMDESLDHDRLLRRMLDQLPSEVSYPREEYDLVVARGYLRRGARAVMWGRTEDGREHFASAAALDVRVDQFFLKRLTAHLLDYEAEFGFDAAENVLRNLCSCLEHLADPASLRWLRGYYAINQAFRNYRNGKYKIVLKDVFNAITNDSTYLANRGAWSILFHSMIGLLNSRLDKSYS